MAKRSMHLPRRHRNLLLASLASGVLALLEAQTHCLSHFVGSALTTTVVRGLFPSLGDLGWWLLNR